ncbi:MAG: sodium:solute symporter family protein [Rhodocyclaceae bacterium]
MLIASVLVYLIVFVAIGLWAATRVHRAKDYVVAGRALPLYVVTATVFATWFGSETVLGISARFVNDGLRGIVEDPFGSSMCLVLVGVFFAAKLYRMDLLTIGDFYRNRYNRGVELGASAAIIASYLGWVSAQIVALGLVFSLLGGGAMTPAQGMLLGASIVLLYTFFGGMFSVAWTDFVQMTLIVCGLIYLVWVIGGEAGGAGAVVAHAARAGKFDFWPAPEPKDVLAFVAAWVTMMFGSIPQQDVFQRVTSARTVRIAVAGTVLGAILYFLFAFAPLFLAYSASLIDPEMVARLIEKDPQHILPTLVMTRTPLAAQIVFFGALLAAIMSTASGTLLAPSVTFTENILKGLLRRELSDRQFLWTLRGVVACFTVIVTAFALGSNSSIYEMVGNAYKVTLVAAFVPLTAGLYWSRATTQGALVSMFLGVAVWLTLEIFPIGGIWPPQLAGLLAALGGMVAGSLLPQRVGRRDLPEPHLRHHLHPARQHVPRA